MISRAATPPRPVYPSQEAPRPTRAISLADSRSSADVAVGRLTLRLDELAAALGVSRRAIERERSAGRFPKPDLIIGRMPLWRPETIRSWIEGGGRP
jgi:predicted DNA-binding transcriptional regulator AlpA